VLLDDPESAAKEDCEADRLLLVLALLLAMGVTLPLLRGAMLTRLLKEPDCGAEMDMGKLMELSMLPPLLLVVIMPDWPDREPMEDPIDMEAGAERDPPSDDWLLDPADDAEGKERVDCCTGAVID